MINITRYILLLLIIGFSVSAKARFATLEDAPIEILTENMDIKINKDGTADTTIETRIRILKEPGRNYAANYTLTYKEDNAQVKILEAKTIYNGTEYKLTPDMIEDKPLASSHQGFDQERQILLSFPKAEIGAEMYLKFNKKEIRPVLDNFYSDRFFYGREGYLHAARMTIKSDIPLYAKVNDPTQAFVIKKDENKDGSFRNFSAELTKPVYTDVVSEAGNSVLDERYLVWLSLSSLTDWKVMAKRFAPNYEKVASETLPNVLSGIVKAAKDIKDEEDQINIVTSLLNEKIQYMGDWRSVAGRFFPRKLDVIVASHSGDCKEFSAMTAAILNALGHKAHAALVLRGEGLKASDNGLPDVGAFNHAFVKVVTKSGAVRWIDPTNSRSMSDGVFPDVAGKMALVLDPKNPTYERVAEIDPHHSMIVMTKKLNIDDNSVVNEGEIILKGESALMLSGAMLYLSQKEIKDNLFFSLSDMQLDEKDKISMTLPDLSSRIVKDITVGFKYRHNSQLFKTNLAPTLKVTSGWVDALAAAAPDQVSDLVIGPPTTIVRKTVIEGLKVKEIKDLNYSKSTPWIDVERLCSYNGNSTEVNDKITIKKTFIPRDDLATDEYKVLRHDLLQNFKNSAVILME